MKIEIDVDLDTITKGMNSNDLYKIMQSFSENDIMDAVLMTDNERGDWILLERMVKYVTLLSVDIESEIKYAKDAGHIEESTYKLLNALRKATKKL